MHITVQSGLSVFLKGVKKNMPDDTYLDDILMDWSKQLDQIACSDGWDYEESADNINRKYAGLVA